MYVDEDGRLYTQEEQDKRKGTTKDCKGTSQTKSTVIASVSTEDLYNNRTIKIFYNKRLFNFKLNSKMKDNEVFSISNIPFLISINLLNKDDYRKYINKITYKTVEIDPDIAKFGGQVEGITIPKETHNLDIIEVLEGDKIEYVTIKIISFEEYEEKSNLVRSINFF